MTGESVMLNNKGFTLIEVLISVFILSVGLLAVAALQTTAMTANTTSMNTTVGVQMAEEMVDRIRANAGNTPAIYDLIDTRNCAAPVHLDPALGDCTQWQSRLTGSGLPSAFGTVTVAADSPFARVSTVTVTVTWGVGATRSITFRTMVETWLT